MKHEGEFESVMSKCHLLDKQVHSEQTPISHVGSMQSQPVLFCYKQRGF